MSPDVLYQVALTLVPNIGAVQAKILVDHFGEAENIFKAKKKDLDLLEGIGEVRANAIKRFNDFTAAEAELAFLEKFRIQPLFLTDEHYPKKLLSCYDSPTLLFYRGQADLNQQKVISIIGTRNNTEYGRQLTEQLVEGLQPLNALVVSGLAYGIDAIAHKSAIQNNLPTVGVLAHGLDTIYPAAHKSLAKQMLLNGGLLSEFRKDTLPDKHNFPRRNRIVAGIADCTIVIETAASGGSMITAELANGYNRDVFAVPGKVSDSKSTGCNYLIKNNKAVLITSAEDVIEEMGWIPKKVKAKQQKELFITLTADEQIIVDLLRQKDGLHVDELFLKSGLTSSTVAAAILNLEFENVVASLPGKMYRLL
jgi:DNA processing protein